MTQSRCILKAHTRAAVVTRGKKSRGVAKVGQDRDPDSFENDLVLKKLKKKYRDLAQPWAWQKKVEK